MKNLVLFLNFFLLLSFISFSCENNTEIPLPDNISNESELSTYLNTVLGKTEVPGFAISIVKENSLSYQEAFGYADIQGQKPYSNQSIQPLASISKTFVAAATLKAIEKGYFDLETEINDLLSVDIINPKQPDAAIKVKHLMTHSSGLLDNPGVYVAENYYILPGEDISTEAAKALRDLGIEQREARSLEDFLAEYYLPGGELYSLDNFAATTPGSSWSYSNVATGLCAYLIESASGQRFDTFVKNEILIPLGMMQSTYDLQEINQEWQVKAYLNRSQVFPRYGNDSYVEGGLYTSNEDIGKYLLDMLQGAQGLSDKLFSETNYAQLFQTQLTEGIVAPDFADAQGLFWYEKEGKIQHGGNSFGVSTQLEFDPVKGEGFVLISNLDASFDYTAYKQALSLIRQGVDKYLQSN